jgi:hypothetical protein
VKWIAVAIIVAALIVSGAVLASLDRRECDDNPYTEQPAC